MERRAEPIWQLSNVEAWMAAIEEGHRQIPASDDVKLQRKGVMLREGHDTFPFMRHEWREERDQRV